MKLNVKFFLSIVSVLVIIVIAITFINTRGAIQAMLSQMEKDGLALAQLLAHSSDFAMRVPDQMEEVVGDQMVVEARIAAHLVTVAEQQAGLSEAEVNDILLDITENTVLDEFWITDETGHAYLHTSPGIDFTFDPDPEEQPQAHFFYPLLEQEDGVVIQEARKREVDDRTFKYVGVSGIDKPRIVQVGYELTFLNKLSRDMNVQKLVDELTGHGNVAAIRIWSAKRETLADSTHPAQGVGEVLDMEDVNLMDAAIRSRKVNSELRDDVFRVAVPMLNEEEKVKQVALFYLLTDSVQAAVRTGIMRSILLSLAVIAAGAGLSFFLSQSITRPVRKLVGAAQAVEQGEKFEPERIADITKSKDELAHLARVFGQMVTKVQAREKHLKRQVEELRIEIDEVKKSKQVKEITETDYFQHLRERAQEIRDKKP
jgi:HAMP domain-containing protein